MNLFARLLLTLSLPALVFLLDQVDASFALELVGIESLYANDYLGLLFELRLSSLTAATGFLFSFLLVEIVIHLKPSFREKRTDPAFRASARRFGWIIALLFVAVQGIGIALWLKASLGLDSVALPRLLVVPCTLTLALYAIARYIDRYGLANGLALLGAIHFAGFALATQSASQFGLLAGGSIVAALALHHAKEHAKHTISVPSAGVVPLTSALGLISWIESNAPIYALVIVLTILLTYTFYAGWRDEMQFERSIKLRVGTSIGIMLAFATYHLEDTQHLVWLSVSPLAMLVSGALLLDIVNEFRFRRAHGAIVKVGEEYRAYHFFETETDFVEEKLPLLGRNYFYRNLFHFWAGYAPVEWWVPKEHADAARALLEHPTTGTPKAF